MAKTVNQLDPAPPGFLEPEALLVVSDENGDEAYKTEFKEFSKNVPPVRVKMPSNIAGVGTITSVAGNSLATLSSSTDYDNIEIGSLIEVATPALLTPVVGKAGSNQIYLSADIEVTGASFQIVNPAFSAWLEAATPSNKVVYCTGGSSSVFFSRAFQTPHSASTQFPIVLDSSGNVQFKTQSAALEYDSRGTAVLPQAETVLVTSGDRAYARGQFAETAYEYQTGRGFVVPLNGLYSIRAGVYVEVNISVPPAPPPMLFRIIGKINGTPDPALHMETKFAFDDYSGYDMSTHFHFEVTKELIVTQEIQFYTSHNCTETVNVNPVLAAANKSTFFEIRYLG